MRAVIFDIDHTIFDGSKLHEGVADLLAILARLGIRIGALTGDDHRMLVRLDEAGIRSYFTSVLCAAHIDYPKAPGGLRRILETLDTPAHHAAMVSHAHSDILLGKNGGLGKIIAVTHGSANTALLKEAGADHVVKDVPAVLDVLG